jgi:hypothetical protein
MSPRARSGAAEKLTVLGLGVLSTVIFVACIEVALGRISRARRLARLCNQWRPGNPFYVLNWDRFPGLIQILELPLAQLALLDLSIGN